MNCSKCRKAYVSVNPDVDEEGAIQPRLIRWKDGLIFQIDQILYKCRATSKKVGGGGIRYDLWTTEDGKCMVRVKITGEVTEVDREVMKALRAEEKRIRRALRSNEGTVKDGIAHQPRIFSLSAVSENEMEKSDWLVDPTSDFANVEARLFVKAKGMRQIRYHDLRHSCASLLLANGVPMKQIQEWLGHSDFSTTANIYAHLDYSSKLTSADAMLNGLGFAAN